MAYFWAVVVVIGIINHAMTSISNLAITRAYSPKAGRKIWHSYNRLVGTATVPATFGDRCAQKIGWGTVPPRIQSLTLLIFLLINIVFSIHGYRITSENM